jgi:SAM-dependent methyltransferase
VAKAEFDSYADTYYEEHKKNIKITGEDPEYFAEYKIADLAHHFSGTQSSIRQIADFGSGIGNSIPYFRRYFPDANLSCVDVSARSIQQAQDRFPGNESFLLIEGESIPIDNASRDIVFSACVFHHIPLEDHERWLKELLRITRPGGVLAIYEHNPLNPLTVRAFNTCPLDKNAVLIRAGTLRSACLAAGWSNVSTAYRLFFPRSLKYLRPLERRLGWLCIGAQYRLLASRR